VINGGNAVDNDWETSAEVTQDSASEGITINWSVPTVGVTNVTIDSKAKANVIGASIEFYIYNFTSGAYDSLYSHGTGLDVVRNDTIILSEYGITDTIHTNITLNTGTGSRDAEFFESRIHYNQTVAIMNASVNTGNDAIEDWNTSELNSTNSPTTADINITAIQAYIDSSDCGYPACNVPIVFGSDTIGVLEISAIDIQYTYNPIDINTTAILSYISSRGTGEKHVPIRITMYANGSDSNTPVLNWSNTTATIIDGTNAVDKNWDNYAYCQQNNNGNIYINWSIPDSVDSITIDTKHETTSASDAFTVKVYNFTSSSYVNVYVEGVGELILHNETINISDYGISNIFQTAMLLESSGFGYARFFESRINYSIVNATLQINSLDFDYYGALNITVNATYYGNATWLKSNDTQTLGVIWSNYSATIPDSVWMSVFAPPNTTQYNVTPFGQTDGVPSINVTSYGYADNASIYVNINNTPDDCWNISAFNNSNRNNSILINTTRLLMFNMDFNASEGLWMWINMENCSTSTYTWIDTGMDFDPMCSRCVSSW